MKVASDWSIFACDMFHPPPRRKKGLSKEKKEKKEKQSGWLAADGL